MIASLHVSQREWLILTNTSVHKKDPDPDDDDETCDVTMMASLFETWRYGVLIDFTEEVIACNEREMTSNPGARRVCLKNVALFCGVSNAALLVLLTPLKRGLS